MLTPLRLALMAALLTGLAAPSLAAFPAGASPQAPAAAADTAALEFFGIRAGARLDELDGRLRGRGGHLRCDRAKADRRVSECRGVLTDPRLGGPVDLWVSAIDSTAAVITLSGDVAAEQLDYWRGRIERQYGRVDARVQSNQWMMQWVRHGRMLRLTWRIGRAATVASVSLVDGRVLDGWAKTRPQPASRTR